MTPSQLAAKNIPPGGSKIDASSRINLAHLIAPNDCFPNSKFASMLTSSLIMAEGAEAEIAKSVLLITLVTLKPITGLLFMAFMPDFETAFNVAALVIL